MAKPEIVSNTIKLTENVDTSKLSIIDELRLLFTRFNNEEEIAIENATKLNHDMLLKVSSLTNLFNTAVDKMKELGETCVTLSVSSVYLPVLDRVISDKDGLGVLYSFEVIRRKDIPINDYYFTVRIRLKGGVYEKD